MNRIPPILLVLLFLFACGPDTQQQESAQDASSSSPSVVADVPDTTATEGDEKSESTDPFVDYRGMMLHYARASTAENDGEFEAARRSFEAGLEIVPSSPHMLLGLARNAALLGDWEAVLDALGRFAATGAHADLEGIGAFDELRSDPEFVALAAEIPPIGAEAPVLEPVTVLRPSDLWNEGIACDLRTGDLYAGSVKHGKIVRVRVRDGVQEDFGTSAQDELMEVLGLDIDESRRELWACTGRDELGEDGRHDFGEAPRANAMVVYSLETGEQLRRWYRAPSDPIHMWNDVSVAPDGTAYFTDMSASQVHRIVPGGEPELLEALESWNYPNGIAVGDDGRLLYVACLEGIRVIDLVDGGSTPLETGDSTHTGLGDGMALRGRDLFLVQNNRLLGFRVLHCRLSEDGRAAVWDESLRFDRLDPMMPFTCALGENELFVNLTLGFDRYDAMLASEDPDPMRNQGSRILSLSYQR